MSFSDTTTYFSASRPSTQYYKGAGTTTILSVAYPLRRIINGASDPHWRDKVARGENATGTLVRTFGNVRYFDYPSVHHGDPNNSTTKHWSASTTSHGLQIGNPDSLNTTSYWSSILPEAESAAITAIRNKVRQEQAAFGGMTFLAELSSTIKGLRNPGKALVENIGSLMKNVSLHNKTKLFGGWTDTAKGRRVNRNISRNRSKRHEDALRDRSRLLSGRTFAETWLEFAFGWVPLVNDCQDIAKGLTKYFWKDQMRRAFGTSGDVQQSTTTYGTSFSSGIPIRIETNYVTTVRIKYSAGVQRKLTGPKGQIAILAGESGSAIHDLLPAIWEAVPWSFLLDYVSNIGDIIGAATQSNTGVAWVSKTTVITVIKTAVATPYQRPGYILDVAGSSTVTTEFTRITRERLSASDLGVPDLTFTFPGSAQLFNVAALLRTFLRN